MKSFLAVFLMVFCLIIPAQAGKHPLRVLGSDLYKTVTAPAHFDAHDWLAAGLVAGGAVTLYSLDSQARDMAQRNRGETTNAVESVVKPFGRIETALPAACVVYLGAKFADNEKLKKTTAMAVESLIISGFIFQSVKYLAHRERPYENTSPYQWHGPGIYDKYQSFPSGDAATAFALLTPFAHQYGNVPGVAPAAYTVAALAGLGRMNHNDHWASDVFTGAALGYFTAKAVIKYREADGTVALLPLINGSARGVMLTARF